MASWVLGPENLDPRTQNLKCGDRSAILIVSPRGGFAMTLLAIETSCDETSAAVVRTGRVLSNVVSSQIHLHAEYGGVVPELASREHLRNLAPITQTALREAKVTPAR